MRNVSLLLFLLWLMAELCLNARQSQKAHKEFFACPRGWKSCIPWNNFKVVRAIVISACKAGERRVQECSDVSGDAVSFR